MRSWRVETTSCGEKFDYAGNIVFFIAGILFVIYMILSVKQANNELAFSTWNQSHTVSIFKPDLISTMKTCVHDNYKETEQNHTPEKLEIAEKTCSYKLLSVIKANEPSDEVYNMALTTLQVHGYWTPVKIMDENYAVIVPKITINDKDIKKMMSETSPCVDKDKTVCIQ